MWEFEIIMFRKGDTPSTQTQFLPGTHKSLDETIQRAYSYLGHYQWAWIREVGRTQPIMTITKEKIVFNNMINLTFPA